MDKSDASSIGLGLVIISMQYVSNLFLVHWLVGILEVERLINGLMRRLLAVNLQTRTTEEVNF